MAEGEHRPLVVDPEAGDQGDAAGARPWTPVIVNAPIGVARPGSPTVRVPVSPPAPSQSELALGLAHRAGALELAGVIWLPMASDSGLVPRVVAAPACRRPG